jgi:hypothetical protein
MNFDDAARLGGYALVRISKTLSKAAQKAR